MHYTFAKLNKASKLICEATGGYELPLISQCNAKVLQICRVNACQVRDFAKASGLLAKTDKLDEEVLVSFGQVFDTRPTCVKDRQLALCELVRYRQTLVDNKSNLLKRYKRLSTSFVKHSIERVRDSVEEEILLCEKEVASFISKDASLEDRNYILQSFPGIGKITAATIISELPELGKFESNKIAALVGVAPYNCDSGKKQGRRSIRGGRKIVRNALYMAAIVAIRHNKKIKNYGAVLDKLSHFFLNPSVELV